MSGFCSASLSRFVAGLGGIAEARADIGNWVTRISATHYRQEDDAVTFRSRYLLALALGLWLIHPTWGWGQEPPRHGMDAVPAPIDNQQLANTIAGQLRQSGQLRQFDIKVVCQNGIVELNGAVSGKSQSDDAIKIAASVPGVEKVVSKLSVSDSKVMRAQATVPAPGKPLPPGGPEPAPVFQGPPPSPYDLNPPKMPPYAWPTYAPYNNYSRVAYPTVYPYEAFPYIGPVYPFPKVPLGWRKVKLEWEDGHWWISNVSSQHDYWRLRYN